MNKKQIEDLKSYLVMIVGMYYKKDDAEITKAINNIDTLLKLMFETYLVMDYDKISKIKKEVMQAGLDKLAELQKAEKENIA